MGILSRVSTMAGAGFLPSPWITQVRLPHPDSPGGLRLRAAAARQSSAGGEGGRAAPGGPSAERRKRAPGGAGRGLPPARSRVENGCFGEKTRHVDGDGDGNGELNGINMN